MLVCQRPLDSQEDILALLIEDGEYRPILVAAVILAQKLNIPRRPPLSCRMFPLRCYTQLVASKGPGQWMCAVAL